MTTIKTKKPARCLLMSDRVCLDEDGGAARCLDDVLVVGDRLHLTLAGRREPVVVGMDDLVTVVQL